MDHSRTNKFVQNRIVNDIRELAFQFLLPKFDHFSNENSIMEFSQFSKSTIRLFEFNVKFLNKKILHLIFFRNYSYNIMEN